MGNDTRTWVADARRTLELARLSCLEAEDLSCLEAEDVRLCLP